MADDPDKKILIVDDEDIIRESLAIYFEDSGFEVFGAYDVNKSIEILEKNSIDAAIVDIRLPGKSGVELLNYIDQHNLKIVCLIHTGSIGFEIPKSLLQNRNIAQDIFVKPIPDISLIEKRIAEMLEQNKQP